MSLTYGQLTRSHGLAVLGSLSLSLCPSLEASSEFVCVGQGCWLSVSTSLLLERPTRALHFLTAIALPPDPRLVIHTRASTFSLAFSRAKQQTAKGVVKVVMNNPKANALGLSLISEVSECPPVPFL